MIKTGHRFTTSGSGFGREMLDTVLVRDLVLLAGLVMIAVISMLLLTRLGRLIERQNDNDQHARLIRLEAQTDNLLKATSQHSQTMRQELKDNRLEIGTALASLADRVHKQGQEQNTLHNQMRDKIDQRLQELQQGNEKKLDEMRRTVDEHLQTSLEKRITESFKTVAERLEAVQKGLGEMQSLATGVGDLKRVLTNVKSRGMFGEVQLEALMVDMLTADQYVSNFDCGKQGQQRVEFAVRLPGSDPAVFLPIDAKFPSDDYERLLNFAEIGDRDGMEKAARELERRIKRFAKDIADKYINPPTTTDWALLFVPTEGLYAEILRRAGLFEALQRDYRVTLAGPSNLQVILSTFRMGYRQVAMNQKSGKVMEILSAVRLEFEKYGSQIEAMAKSLDSARNHVDKLGTRRNVMLKALKKVDGVESDDELLLLEEKQSLQPVD